MVGCEFQRLVRAGRVVVCTALLVGCTQTIHNDPINQPLTANAAKVERAVEREAEPSIDDMVVALSFSGGGMRAAAFSYGVLTGFDETPVQYGGRHTAAARSHRLHLRRIGRFGAGGLLRA